MTRRSVTSRYIAAGLACASLLMTVRPARADDAEPVPHARVVVEATTVRSGPGPEHRAVYTAHRDEVFPIRARASREYWFQIVLPDGTTGWILGDAVYTFEVFGGAIEDGRLWPEVLAPPPLPEADGEVAIQLGALGGGGMLAIRPSILIAPSFGLELSGVVAVASGGRLLSATVGPIVNVFASSPIQPFVTLAAGMTASSPNADTFVLQSGSIATANAGGGLRIGFRYRLTLRLEARAHVYFEPDRYVTEEELSAGLTVFF